MDDGHMAVIAHGLINSAAAVAGSISSARHLFERLEGELPATVEELLSAAERQAGFIADSLGDLIRAMPQEVLRVLDEADPAT